jgi:hypothetical protein
MAERAAGGPRAGDSLGKAQSERSGRAKAPVQVRCQARSPKGTFSVRLARSDEDGCPSYKPTQAVRLRGWVARMGCADGPVARAVRLRGRSGCAIGTFVHQPRRLLIKLKTARGDARIRHPAIGWDPEGPEDRCAP